MSKRIIMSLLSAAAMSIGGWFVSCGSNDDSRLTHAVVVQLPDGWSLESPRSQLEGLGSMGAVVNVKPGPNRFVLTNGESEVSVTKHVADGAEVLSISEQDLR